MIELFEENYNIKSENILAIREEFDNLVLAANWAREKGEARLLALLVTKPRNWLYVIFVAAWDEWLEWLNEALRIGKDYESALQANVLKAIGDVQQFRDERDAALASYAQALELFRAVGARLGEANVLAAQCRLLVQAGELTQAEKNLAQVIAIRREIGDLYSEGADYGNFAIALLNAGEKTKAKTYALKAKQVFQKIGEPSLTQQVDRLIGACE